MSWIQTYVGKQFWPLAPRAEDLDILDIAHSLSLQCRFNGHSRVFYSVADHSVRVAENLPRDLALWGLLHDAAEAYLGDLSRPLKSQLEAQWFNDAEDRLLRIIAETYGLAWPMPPQVRAADDVLLVTEARDLMREPPADWCLEAKPLAARIEPLEPAAAEALFLERYEALR
jgi:5'-nucleotidase